MIAVTVFIRSAHYVMTYELEKGFKCYMEVSLLFKFLLLLLLISVVIIHSVLPKKKKKFSQWVYTENRSL